MDSSQFDKPQGETPRTDAFQQEQQRREIRNRGKRDDTVSLINLESLDFARQLERELVVKVDQAHAVGYRDGYEKALQSATVGSDFLHDDRFTGAFVEHFVDSWAEQQAASTQAAFTENDLQRLLDFGTALSLDLTGEAFEEFCAKVLPTTATPSTRSEK